MNLTTSRFWPPLMLAAITLIWGYSWVVTKQALDYAPPFVIGAQRSLLGALALLAIAKWMGKSLKLVAPVATFFIGLGQITGFVALSNWAVLEGGAGKTSVLVFTMPIWTLLIAWPVLGERVRGQQWLAVAFALGGMLLIIEPWNLHTSLFSKILGVSAALCWAIGTVLVKRLRAKQSIDLLVFTGWQMLFGALPLIFLALVVPESPTHWTLNYLALLLILALVATALGWWIWLDILDRLPAWEASLSVLGTPVVAVIASRWVTGEEFRMTELAGMLLVGSGLALLSLRGWLASRRAAPRT